MNQSNADLDFLLQVDNQDKVQNQIGVGQWLTAYQSTLAQEERVTIHCALIPNDVVSGVLENTSWDLLIGTPQPGCSIHYVNGGKAIIYHRFSTDNGIEPLLMQRHFFGLRPGYTEILEEFRLFHNLYYDQPNDRYIKIDDDGNEIDVVRVERNRVQIRQKEIRQFIALKNMHLAIYFEFDRQSTLPFDMVDSKLHETTVRLANLSYNVYVYETIPSHTEEYNTLSRLVGKKLIPPLPKEASGIWPYNVGDEAQYTEFVIGASHTSLS